MADEKDKKKKRKHLHQIRTVFADDGSAVHHHTYKKDRKDNETEPERLNVATSDNADEAGEHVAEQGGMNEQGEVDPGEAQPEAQPAPDASADPTAAAGGM